MNKIIVVQGGTWGSEAKGAIAAHLGMTRDIDIAVRTGAINAGHTVVYGGVRFAMQQIPVGWINPRTMLVIGAGAYIHPPTLEREIAIINAAMPDQDVRTRLFIDNRCGVHDEEHEGLSKDANRHHRIGATGKGCSEAIVGKIRNRNAGYELFVNTPHSAPYDRTMFVDTVRMLNKAYDNGKRILLEGTQGTLLDLHLGPYPFTTSRMTSAANWVAEAGLSPSLPYEVVLVVRTFPIRVAGNSGPMTGEIEWTDLARDNNSKMSNAGRPSRVSLIAIMEFESALERAADMAERDGRYSLPDRGQGPKAIRVSSWTASERSTYRVAASELHRDALNLCSPTSLRELKKLFEMTTVTKKLRRIANICVEDLQYAIAINRPAWIALTFLDYVEPELANVTLSDIHHDIQSGEGRLKDALGRASRYVNSLADRLGVPILTVSTGPNPEHTFDSYYLTVRQSDK